MFYTFRQNNSGGHFHFDEESGITHYTIIEANDEWQCREIAENIGIYFDGYSIGMDCSCCGDRWRFPYDEPSENPEFYGEIVKKDGDYGSWMEQGKNVCVHYLDGRKEWF